MHPVRDLYFMARSVLVITDMIGDTLKREWLIQGEEGMSRYPEERTSYIDG